jgi:hypothetical protein
MFMLDMGLVAGRRLLKKSGLTAPMVLFALYMPLTGALLALGMSILLALPVGTATLLGVWDAILRPIAMTYADDPLGLVFAAAPPVGDVVLLGATVVALRRRPDAATGEATLLLAMAMVSYAVGDIVYATRSLAGTYASGDGIDGAWLIGSLLITAAAVRQREPSASEAALARTEAALNRGAMLVPIVSSTTTGISKRRPKSAKAGRLGVWRSGLLGTSQKIPANVSFCKSSARCWRSPSSPRGKNSTPGPNFCRIFSVSV